ncbi:MAG: dTMP kinase [Syntrophobacterales bacterium]|nr:MAG: dTMP kinase [Syntrophobacterales bacterium]
MRLFITFEGIEGSGKTTQIQLLRSHVEQKGYRCQITREPGGCRIGNKIRDILMDSDNETLTPMSELYLIMANRAQHVTEVIEPALKAQKILICDRFHDATIAYQGFARGMALDLIETLNQTVTKGVKPDLTILLDCPVEVGLKRARGRMAAEDSSWKEGRFEGERGDFHQRVRDAYLTIAKAEPDRIKVVDGSRDGHTVEREIRRLVNPFLK